MSTADAHQARSGGASRAGWIVCLLLVIALGVAAWFAWRQGTAVSEPAPGSVEMNALRASIRELEVIRQDLRALLQADPCAIPDERHGLSFMPAAGQEGE